MFGLFAVFLLAVFLAFFWQERPKSEVEIKALVFTEQIGKLWDVAKRAMNEKKPLQAEKALLTILRFDEKNAAAYNRLGILYAKEKQYKEAVECFEIAQSLDMTANSLHNTGLIYLETGDYEKSSIAFRQAIELEAEVPGRYIALAKAEEKMGKIENAIQSLELAYKLNKSLPVLKHILQLYESENDQEMVKKTRARVERVVEAESAKTAAAQRPKRAAGVIKRRLVSRKKLN
jgi:tetratricopeptide (TPR) repeat protein